VVICRSSGSAYAQALTKNAGLGWKQSQGALGISRFELKQLRENCMLRECGPH